MEREMARVADAEIVRQVLRGHKDRFRELIERHERRVYKLALSLVDAASAVDVVQETFIRAYTYLDGFDPERGFANWILKIAHNQALTFLERHRRDVAIDATDPPEPDRGVPGIPDDPAALAEEKDLRRGLERAIRQLPEKYRIVIHLRHTQDRKLSEIAQILDLPLGTVKFRFHEAYAMLRKALIRAGGGEP